MWPCFKNWPEGIFSDPESNCLGAVFVQGPWKKMAPPTSRGPLGLTYVKGPQNVKIRSYLVGKLPMSLTQHYPAGFAAPPAAVTGYDWWNRGNKTNFCLCCDWNIWLFVVLCSEGCSRCFVFFAADWMFIDQESLWKKPQDVFRREEAVQGIRDVEKTSFVSIFFLLALKTSSIKSPERCLDCWRQSSCISVCFIFYFYWFYFFT